jgi:hypothetical protein
LLSESNATAYNKNKGENKMRELKNNHFTKQQKKTCSKYKENIKAQFESRKQMHVNECVCWNCGRNRETQIKGLFF